MEPIMRQRLCTYTFVSSTSLFFFLCFSSCFTPSFSSLTAGSWDKLLWLLLVWGTECHPTKLWHREEFPSYQQVRWADIRLLPLHPYWTGAQLGLNVSATKCISKQKVTGVPFLSIVQGNTITTSLPAWECTWLVMLNILNLAACHFLNGNFPFSFPLPHVSYTTLQVD